MPHFIIHCSPNLIQQITPVNIMNAVYDTASASGLFVNNDIKVRLQAFEYFKLGEGKESFIHVFAYIMEGRTIEQKAGLAKQITTKLNELIRDVSFLSINIDDFESATYCNKSLIDPANSSNSRHFGL